jgi:hypothetical protein
MSMNEITKNKIDNILTNMTDVLSYLYDRWMCEKEYEDFGEYAQNMQTNFKEIKKSSYSKNAIFVKACKKPFGFLFDFEGWEVTIYVTSKQIGWKAKSIH